MQYSWHILATYAGRCLDDTLCRRSQQRIWRETACRYVKLRFAPPGAPAAVCHGFAGYFDAQLYGDVTLSIHPPTHTSDMFSWFPIFFPLQTPVHLAAGEVRKPDAQVLL